MASKRKEDEEKLRPKYLESEQTGEAKGKLSEWENSSTGEYTSKYSEQLNELLNKVLNREKFSYDMNADALYNQYKDQYVRQGKLAMQDTLGQSAALTGGYGSSYGVTAGNQAYQGWLTELNSIVPELSQNAYDRYLAEMELNRSDYGTVKALDENDYSRYRDSVSDYQKEGEYLSNKVDKLSDEDWQRYIQLVDAYESDRTYDYGVGRDLEKDRQWQTQLDYQKQRDAVEDEQWQKQYNLSASKSSGSSKSTSSSSAKTLNVEKELKRMLYETGAIAPPETYSEFVKETGYAGVLTPTEFAKRTEERREYNGSYPDYLKKMFKLYY